jgi:hypothetical protein
VESTASRTGLYYRLTGGQRCAALGALVAPVVVLFVCYLIATFLIMMMWQPTLLFALGQCKYVPVLFAALMVLHHSIQAVDLAVEL